MPRTTHPLRAVALFLLAGVILMGFGECSGDQSRVQQRKDANVAAVSANLKPIADDLSATGRPAEGAAIRSQAQVLDATTGLKPEEQPAPAVTAEQWRAAQGDEERLRRVVQVLGAQAADLGEQLAKAQGEAGGAWAWLRSGAALAGALSVGTALARAFNVPGSGLIDLAAKALMPKAFDQLHQQVAAVTEKNAALVTTVAASDVGREALAHADAVLARNPAAQRVLQETLRGLTGGQADTLQDYFKAFAAAHATDQGMAGEVAGVLSEIRSETPTTGGRSDAFAAILGALQSPGAGPKAGA